MNIFVFRTVELFGGIILQKYRVNKCLCAPDDYNTESYKYGSKFPPPVSRHLLTRRTLFSKTMFSTVRYAFRMYSVMAIFNLSIVWGLFVRCTETFDRPAYQLYTEQRNLFHASHKAPRPRWSTTREKFQTTARRAKAKTHKWLP
jgi:hypothetical protein